MSALSLEQRLGPGVLCGVVRVHGDPEALLAPERSAVASAVPARQREFAAGRTCARALLARLGLAPVALPPGHDRRPQWPPGVLGSIAHDKHLCAVVVARAQRFASLGIDIEPAEPLERELWSTLFLARELEALDRLPPAQRGRTARLFFSAKECVYKCVHPLLGTGFGFHDVEIELLPHGRFRVRFLSALGERLRELPLHGFHVACEGSVLTGMALTHPLPAAVAPDAEQGGEQ